MELKNPKESTCIYVILIITISDKEKHLKRLRNKPISSHSDKERLKKKSNKKKLTKGDRRELNLFSFKSDEVKYEYFIELNKLWQKYIQTLLPNKGILV